MHSSPLSPSNRNTKPNLTEVRLSQIFDSSRPLCRDDVVWMLELIKKKVAEEDPRLTDLTQPRLLQNFRYFAEISLMLIHRRGGFDSEADRLKDWLLEASFGLHDIPPASQTIRPKSS